MRETKPRRGGNRGNDRIYSIVLCLRSRADRTCRKPCKFYKDTMNHFSDLNKKARVVRHGKELNWK